MANTYNEQITRNTDWGGDASTSGLPVSGRRVQEFVKSELNSKIGSIYKPEGGNKVYCFSNEEDKEEFIDTGNEELAISSFETMSNFSVKINTETLVRSYSVINGTTGNTVSFQFMISDANGMISDSRASIEYSCLSQGILQKYTSEVQINGDGWTTVTSEVLDRYLRKGENTITIAITGLSTKTSSQFIVTYNIFDLSYEAMFEYNVVQTGNTIAIPYMVECTDTKYLMFYLDGVWVEPYESTVISDYRKDSTANINISHLEPGIHTLQTYAYVRANDGTMFKSNIYYYTFAVDGDADPSFLMSIVLPNTQLIAKDGATLTIYTKEFEQINFDWSIFDYHERKLVVNFEYAGDVITKSIIDKNGEVNTFMFRPMEHGYAKPLIMYAVDDEDNRLFEYTIYFDVEETDMGIRETTDGLLLKLQSQGRRNTDLDKDIWSCIGNDGNEYRATFNNFTWSEQCGWNADTESLVISNGATVDFNIQPMINEWERNGGTIEIDLETFDIEDDNAVICECFNSIPEKPSAFFRITSTKAEFSTKDGISIDTRYKDNERLKIAFIGNKVGQHEDGNLIYIVVNGVLERAALYEDTDKLYSDAFLKIGNPEGNCKVRLRSIRVYNKAITVDEAFNNYVVDSDDVQNIYEKNNVLKPGTNEVGFDEVANKLPVMIFTGDMAEIAKNGQDKKWRYFDVEYINRQEPERNFVSFNCRMKLQGTSSLGYPRKNFKLSTKDKNFNKDSYAASVYELDPNSQISNLMLRNKRTGRQLDVGDLNGNCFTFDYEGKPLKKGKYRFRENCHKADKWTLKADFMESSCSHNVAAGRSWNDIFENTLFELTLDAGYTNNTYKDSALVDSRDYIEYNRTDGAHCKINNNTEEIRAQKKYVCRTDAQKICHAENADDIRTAVDGFPMVCFYRTSHQTNNLVFMGQYNFINDKGSYEVFGFEDIEHPDDEETFIYDASKVECWEGLKNANPISLFKTIDNWEDPSVGWASTYESRYPDPDDYGVDGKRWYDASIGSPLYELSKWLVSTRHESGTTYSGTLNIDASFARRINDYQYGYTIDTQDSFEYAEGVNLEDNAENRQKKFETEKWEHFDVWKLAGYYIYLMRYGAVDQFVKNTMLFTDGNGKYDNRPDNKYRKWFFINYDNDCLFGLRNNGEIAFDWKLDRQTLDGANDIIEDENNNDETDINTYAMMGHESTLWNNLERDDEFMRMVRDLDNAMSTFGLNYNNMVKEFDTNQTEQWCERIYNANERYKYIQAAKGIGDMSGNPVNNLWMLQGTRRSHRHWWIANHFNLLDAKWLSGDYKNTYVQLKTDCFAGDTIHASAGTDYYFAWGQQKKIYESNMVRDEGEAIEFVFDTNQVQGDPVYIYAINKMSTLDFSDIAYKVAAGSFEFHVGDTNVANLLKKLIIGNPNVVNRMTGIATSTWASLTNLEYLDITNYNGIKTIPLSAFKNLHTFKANGSALGSFVPANGSNFDLIELPNTIATIEMNDVGINNLVNDFKYTPNTTLDSLTLSNNAGIGMTYYNNLIKPWINTIEASANAQALYRECKIDVSDINWSFSKLSDIMLFKNFKQYAKPNNFNLRGYIDITACGNLSMQNINDLIDIFGENCFSETMGSLYIKTPNSVFLDVDRDEIVAGETITISRTIYPSENAIADLNPDITYYIVQETPLTPDEDERVIVDVITGKNYLPINDLSLVRQGITLTNTIDENGKQIAILATDEIVTNTDTNMLILVNMKIIGQFNDCVSVMNFTIKDPTYAATITINGETSLYKNKEYSFDLEPLTNRNVAPIGTYHVNWVLSGDAKTLYVDESGPVDNKNLKFVIKTNQDQPETSEPLYITAILTNYNTTVVSETIKVLILNENVIMTSESNPIVMEMCYQKGWTNGSPDAMRKDQAEAVTDIEDTFKNITTKFSFYEFQYFTGLTSISNSAFTNSKITTIVLPNTIQNLGEGTFYNCQELTDVLLNCGEGENGETIYENTLPFQITQIPTGCFCGCRKLTKLRLPDNVIAIRDFAFGGTNITHALLNGAEFVNGVLILPDGLTTIERNAFEQSEWSRTTTSNPLKVLEFPLQLNIIRDLPLVYGKNYEEFRVPAGQANYLSLDGVLYDGRMATLIKYPADKPYEEIYEINNVTTLNDYSFFGVKNLDTLITPTTLGARGLGTHVFEDSKIRVIDLSNSVNITEIPQYTFFECTDTEYIYLPNEGSIKTFGIHTFDGCASLIEIEIPYGLESIDNGGTAGRNYFESNVFVGCNALTEIRFPDTLASAGYNLVKECPNVATIKLPTYMQYSAFNPSNSNVKEQRNTLFNCLGLKKLILPVFSYTDDEENNVVLNTTLPQFYTNCPNIEQFVLPSEDNGNVVVCVDGALITSDQSTLLRVPSSFNDYVIPNTITIIGANAMEYTKMTSIVIPQNVTIIGNNAFQASSLEHVELNEGLLQIGSYAFADCPNITEINLPNSLTSLGQYVFRSTNLTDITIPKNITTIQQGLCQFCGNLRSITILGDSVDTIEGIAFYNASNVDTITIATLTAPILKVVHPFTGVGNPGRENKLYVPYNAVGYDSTAQSQNWVNPLQTSSNFQLIYGKPITDAIYVKCYDDTHVEVTQGTIYGVCERGAEIVLAYYNPDGYMLVSGDYNIVDNEIVTLYYDSDHTDEIGSFNIRFFEISYIIGTPIFGASPRSLQGAKLGSSDEESSENEYVKITKEEYETINTKINQLHSIIKNFTK